MDLGYDTLVNLSQALRKEFPPPAILFGNFEGAWIAHGKLFPKVPESWDLCSADMYRNVDPTKRDGAGWPLAGELYAEHLLPKMAAHQKAVFVPGTFASPATLADDDTAAAAQLQLFLGAALNDTRIGGFSCGALRPLPQPLPRLMVRGCAQAVALRQSVGCGECLVHNAVHCRSRSDAQDDGRATDHWTVHRRRQPGPAGPIFEGQIR